MTSQSRQRLVRQERQTSQRALADETEPESAWAGLAMRSLRSNVKNEPRSKSVGSIAELGGDTPCEGKRGTRAMLRAAHSQERLRQLRRSA